MNNNDKIKVKIDVSDKTLLRAYAQKDLVERFMNEFSCSQKVVALSAALTLLFNAVDENTLEIVQDFSSKNKNQKGTEKYEEKEKNINRI